MKQPDLDYLTKLCREGVVGFEPVIYASGAYHWGSMYYTDPIIDIRNARSELLRREGVWANLIVMSLDLFDTFCANEGVNEYRKGRPAPIDFRDIVYEQVQIDRMLGDYEWKGDPYCCVVCTASGR